MNKPLLLSLAAATLLGSNLNAESMYDRIQAMELEMNKMRKELTTLKAENAQEDEEESDTISADDEESEDEEKEDADSDEESDEEEEEMDVEEEIRDMQESITELNKATNGSHLKFGIDYRFAVENMQYKMAGKDANGKDKHSNDAFMTNRLWMNMSWAATKNLSFKGQLAYNKAFGQRSGVDGVNGLPGPYESFDWIANENAYDDILRVRSAYFLYKDSSAALPWAFSIGRRPSTNGHLINLRDDDQAASPMGHTINVEFDGLSAKFGLENLTGADGMYVKFCAGRGMSNAAPKFTYTPYAEVTDDNTNIDLAGLIFVPYDNGHYSVASQYYYASNLIDMSPTGGFDTVGGMHSVTANFIANGIGDEWSDFLDDTIFFLSGAASITDPDKGGINPGMLGSADAETGYSAWVGLQIPSLISEDGRWGVEYNYGSQYWRSITYAEDTNIGSKVATRGNSYEAYFTEYLVEDILSLQIRYTYLDYKYTGSNGFFGDSSGRSRLIEDLTSGNPMDPMDASYHVDKAQDIRFYLRYKY